MGLHRRALGAFFLSVLLSTSLFAAPCVDNEPCTVELPGSECGDGTQSFIRVTERKNAKGLFIFLNGGGACWDNASCGCDTHGKCSGGTAASGLTRIDPNDIGDWNYGSGWRDSSDPANPIAQGYNVIEMPYCTGDIYTGTKNAKYGNATVRHQGFKNVRLMLEEATRRFTNLDKVVFMGCSAGGLGVTFNVDQLRNAFPSTPAYVISDSGLPFKSPHIDAGRIKDVMGAWGADQNLPAGFDKGPDGIADMGDMVRFNGTAHADVRFTLFSTYRDSIMSFFAAKVGSPYPSKAVEKTMIDVADNDMVAKDAQKVFYLDGTRHCFNGASPSTIVSAGVKMSDFVKKMLSDDPTWAQVRPRFVSPNYAVR